MLTRSDLTFGVVLPLLLSTLILLLAWRPWRRKDSRPARWGGPLAVGASFATTFAALQGVRHAVRASSAIMWLFYVGLGFTLLALIDAPLGTATMGAGILVFVASTAGRRHFCISTSSTGRGIPCMERLARRDRCHCGDVVGIV